MSTTRRLRILIALALSALLLAGCSDQSGPQSDDVLGDVNPAGGAAALKSLTAPDADGRPVRVELLSGPVRTENEGESVILDVHLRNAGERPLGLPITVWIGDFRPDTVWPRDPDFVTPTLPGEPSYYGWEFGPLDGGDMTLEPGEITHFRTWTFHDPGQVPFTFGGWIEAPPSGGAVLGGLGFFDEDADGTPDFGEDPFSGYAVRVTRPDGMVVEASAHPDGRWEVPLLGTGLHTVRYFPMIDGGPAPLPLTTPNPREVIITPDADGRPQSFTAAHLGIDRPIANPVAPIVLTDAPVDSLRFAPWQLLEMDVLHGRVLRLHVGFSGCGPDHPFTLFAAGGYLESIPLQRDLVLRHEVDEECDAYWQQEIAFDLTPLIQEFLAMNGPGELQCNLVDFEGARHSFVLEIYPED